MAGILAMGLTVACGKSDNANGPAGTLHTIVVAPATDTLAVGATNGFTATGHNASGRTISGLTFFWSTSNPAVAKVNQSGQALALSVGQAQIAASVSGISGIATLVVTPKPVGSIVVVPSSATLRVATTLQLSDTIKDASGKPLQGQTVTWSSDSASIAAVDGNGLVTARALGVAHIAAAAGGKSTKATITVSQVPVSSITITPANPSVFVTQTTQLTATTKDSAGNILTGRVVRWSVANPPVAMIDSVAGLLTGVSVGATYVRARSEGITDSVLATVSNAPANTVVLSPSAFSTDAGQTVSYSATVTNSSGGTIVNPTVNYSSGNNNIASVTSQTGATAQVLAGPNTGTVTITGTSGPATGTASLFVTLKGVDSVHISYVHDTLSPQQSETLTATAYDSSGNVITGRAVTWQSSNTGVATINGSGTVTAVAPGVTVIFATISGVKGSLALFVNLAVGSITITPLVDTVQVLGQLQLTAVVRDNNGNIINPSQTWYSTNTSVAVVTSSGLVSGQGSNSTAIFPTMIIDSVGGKADTNTTYVLAPVTSVVVTPGSPSITTVQTQPLTATLQDAYGDQLSGRTVNWTSSNHAVDTVSQSGIVYPLGTGVDTITATAPQPTGNVHGISVVTVTPDPVASVDVAPRTATIYATSPNSTVQLIDSALDAGGTYLPGQTVTWMPTSGGVATVNASGLVTATNSAAGAATITATSTSNPSAAGTATITVLGHSASDTVNIPAPATLSLSGGVNGPTSTSATVKVIDSFGNQVEPTRPVIWTSSDPSTVTINGSTSPVTMGAGSAVTLATVSTGTQETVTITVTAQDNASATNTAAVTVGP